VTSRQQYDQAFIEVFGVKAEDLNAALVYQSIAAWDSVGHMTLMTAIEGAFNIMFEMDDILDFSSYEKGKEILAKYDVNLR
jgi:acyl carrier protein